MNSLHDEQAIALEPARGKRLRRLKLISAAVLAMGLMWSYTVYVAFSVPDVSYLRALPPGSTSFMNNYDGDKPIRYEWVPRSRISPALARAVVVAEDDGFWDHPGFEWAAIKTAARRDWKKKRLAYGASTITQQLARNLFLSSSKNPFRKMKELLIALKLERELPKERILELYLNVVEWGDGVYGAEAAAQHYFGTSAARLGSHEAAFLAAILPRPRFYDAHRNGPYLQRRIASIASRL